MNQEDDAGLASVGIQSISQKKRRRRREIDPESPRDLEAALDRSHFDDLRRLPKNPQQSN